MSAEPSGRGVAAMEAIADPLDRYCVARDEEMLLRAAASRLVEVRAIAVLELHEAGESYRAIADRIGLTRARAQQLVQQGKRLRQHARLLGERNRKAGVHAVMLSEQTRALIERGHDILGRERAEPPSL